MITRNSIDLKRIDEPCYALARGHCLVLIRRNDNCGSYKCPFYKPKDCKAWVRIEDRQGINLIPPEEAFGRK